MARRMGRVDMRVIGYSWMGPGVNRVLAPRMSSFLNRWEGQIISDSVSHGAQKRWDRMCDMSQRSCVICNRKTLNKSHLGPDMHPGSSFALGEPNPKT